MTIKELIVAMQESQKRLSDIGAKIKVTTDEEKTQYESAFKVEQDRFDGFKTDLAELKAESERAKAIEDAEALEKTQTRANIAPEGQPGSKVSARDNAEQDAYKRKSLFVDYCMGGPAALDGVAFAAMRGKSHRAMSARHKGAISMRPEAVCDMIQPGQKNYFNQNQLGKTMLSSDTTGYSTDSKAGLLVPDNLLPEVLEEPVYVPTYYDLVTRIPAAEGRWEYPQLDQTQAGNFGGVSFAYPSTEGAAKTETTPYFTNNTGQTYELAGLTYVSNILLSRSVVDIETYLRRLFGQAMKYKWSYDIKRGTGSSQPEGILGSSSTTSVARQTANKVDWKDLTNLEFGVTKGNRTNARYIIEDSAEKYLKQTIDSENRPLFTADTANSIRNKIAGYPYLTDEFEPELGTEGDVIFGNMKNYGFAIEKDIMIDRSDHFQFDKHVATFRVICWIGGKPLHPRTFAVLGDPES